MGEAPSRQTDDGRSAGGVDIFLCHNSRDKPLVRQVAEGLELEFGIPHFLDDYAIPTGEAFLPWIERALETSGGCAIFLGANGWGDTHFWEAQRALERYRVDTRFRLIPVVLPGAREEDMKRLGSGSLFQDLNWADFREGPVNPQAIAKLRAALLGQTVSAERGPARLTPYLVRRDAQRWQDSRRRDKSILYRGRQLEAANALRALQPDLTAGDAISAFLAASAAAQVRSLRRLVLVATGVAIAIALLAWRAQEQGRLALARFVASEARQAASPDTALLLAVQAAAISDTPEAQGALLERLDALPHLYRLLRTGDAAVSSLTFDPSEERLYVGGDDGRIVRVDLKAPAAAPVVVATLGSEPLAMDLDGGSGELWVGTQDGQVVVLGADGRRLGAMRLADDRVPILSLQISPDGRWVAVGNHNQKLALIDRAQRRQHWIRSIETQRVTGVSFNVDGQRLAAGGSNGLSRVFRTVDGERIGQMNSARTGSPRALQFARNGDLRVIDDGVYFHVFAMSGANGSPRELASGGLSAAVVGPRIERGPLHRIDLMVIGFGSGDIVFTPARPDGDDPLRVRAHARAVRAVALSNGGRWAASGSDDGSVAVWDLTRRSLLFETAAPPGGEVLALAFSGSGMLAVTNSDDGAALAAWTATGWNSVVDLMALSAVSAGAAAIAVAKTGSDSEGFEQIPESVLAAAAFAPGASHLAWTTRRGALLWTPWPQSGPPLVLRASGPPLGPLAMAAGGRWLYAGDGEAGLLRFDTAQPKIAPRSITLPEPLRIFVPAGDGGVDVALNDRTLRRIDFGSSDSRETARIALPVVAGRLAREPGSGRVLFAGAGASAGVDLGVVSGDAYRRLHARRVGGAVSSVVVGESAGLIAAGDHDGRLHLWDLQTLVPMASLQPRTLALTPLEIAPDGSSLALASGGDVLRIALDRRVWRAMACELVGRELTDAEWQALAPGTRPRAACAEARAAR